MKTHKIAVIAGDGIGPEVIGEGIRVLNEIARLDGGFKFEFTHIFRGVVNITKKQGK